MFCSVQLSESLAQFTVSRSLQVRHFVSANPELINAQPCGRYSVLHQAAEAGQAAVVRALVSNFVGGWYVLGNHTKDISKPRNEKRFKTIQNWSEANEPLNLSVATY